MASGSVTDLSGTSSLVRKKDRDSPLTGSRPNNLLYGVLFSRVEWGLVLIECCARWTQVTQQGSLAFLVNERSTFLISRLTRSTEP